MCTCNKELLTRELLVFVLIFMRPRKSCQEKILSNFAYTGTYKACQGNLSRQTWSSCRRVSKLVKILVNENTGINILMAKPQTRQLKKQACVHACK